MYATLLYNTVNLPNEIVNIIAGYATIRYVKLLRFSDFRIKKLGDWDGDWYVTHMPTQDVGFFLTRNNKRTRLW